MPAASAMAHTWMQPKGCQQWRRRRRRLRWRWFVELQLRPSLRKLINNSFVVVIVVSPQFLWCWLSLGQYLGTYYYCSKFSWVLQPPTLWTQCWPSSTRPPKERSLHKTIGQNAASVNYPDSLFNYLIYSVYRDGIEFDCHFRCICNWISLWLADSYNVNNCVPMRKIAWTNISD